MEDYGYDYYIAKVDEYFREEFVFWAVAIEFILFLLTYINERIMCRKIENFDEKKKTKKKASILLIISSSISLILTFLMLVYPKIDVEYHITFLAVYTIYHFIMANYYLIKLILKRYSFALFLRKVFLTVIVFAGAYFLSEDVKYMYVNNPVCLKPIIYLYPKEEMNINIKLENSEKLSCVYPKYNNGWEVIAQPNGDLIDVNTGRNLYCLYWEGEAKAEYKFEDGFVVTGEDSAKFLEEKLAILGLNEREANEFIIYWLPKLEANKYNLIRFETMEEIENYMPLNVEPKPDSIIRVMMDFKGLNKLIEIKEQKLEPINRTGYTVVEWGGTEF